MLKTLKTERLDNYFYRTLHSETLRWDSLVSRKATWGEEYLQGDEWKVQGEEEQVVLIIVAIFEISFSFQAWNTSCQGCIEKNATDT